MGPHGISRLDNQHLDWTATATLIFKLVDEAGIGALERYALVTAPMRILWMTRIVPGLCRYGARSEAPHCARSTNASVVAGFRQVCMQGFQRSSYR